MEHTSFSSSSSSVCKVPVFVPFLTPRLLWVTPSLPPMDELSIIHLPFIFSLFTLVCLSASLQQAQAVTLTVAQAFRVAFEFWQAAKEGTHGRLRRPEECDGWVKMFLSPYPLFPHCHYSPRLLYTSFIFLLSGKTMIQSFILRYPAQHRNITFCHVFLVLALTPSRGVMWNTGEPFGCSCQSLLSYTHLHTH